MKKTILLVLVASLFHGNASAQRISPFQPGSYYPGLVNLLDLAAPPPGLLLLDYNYWMWSTGYFDNEGVKFTGGSIPLPPPSDPVHIDFEPGSTDVHNPA